MSTQGTQVVMSDRGRPAPVLGGRWAPSGKGSGLPKGTDVQTASNTSFPRRRCFWNTHFVARRPVPHMAPHPAPPHSKGLIPILVPHRQQNCHSRKPLLSAAPCSRLTKAEPRARQDWLSAGPCQSSNVSIAYV